MTARDQFPPRYNLLLVMSLEPRKMRMLPKALIVGALVSAAMAVAGAANAVVCGDPGAATLAQAFALGSCTVEDKTFSFDNPGFPALFLRTVSPSQRQTSEWRHSSRALLTRTLEFGSSLGLTTAPQLTASP